ncbi:PAS domain S-box protein, partial [Escherichia coli]|nr:PAS domain S-box protein [Escherichia coli]
QNANDLIYTHDLNGNFLSLNRAGQRITGYTEEEAKQLNIADVISPEFLPTAAEMIDRKLKGSPPTIYSTEIIAKDGRRIPLEVNTRL